MNEKILIVEDEKPIRLLIRMALESSGFKNFYEADNGNDAIEYAKKYLPDIIILDLMLPGMDGLSVCRTLKANETTRNIPIVMLTAKSEESDIVIGLEIGASDYIIKPFNRKVLAARVRAHLRSRVEIAETTEIRRYGLVINEELHSIKLDGLELDLTYSEFEILKLMAAHPGRVYTRNQIISRIKGDGYPVTERSIDVQIVNLRRKLGEWGSNIETIRGIGYRLKGN